jgi:hypothetical protein
VWAFALFVETMFQFGWFYDHVRNKGPWDYKQCDHAARRAKTVSRYEDWGNFHYGATAYAMGIPKLTAMRAAGWANQRAASNRTGFGDPGGGILEIILGVGAPAFPYGDDKHDQHWISRGYEWARHHYVPGKLR